MSFSSTVTNVNSEGNLKSVHGTFTSANGDTEYALNNAIHGLDYIVDYNVTLDSGGIATPQPKVTISSGTLTALWTNTQGYSGKFYVKGR